MTEYQPKHVPSPAILAAASKLANEVQDAALLIDRIIDDRATLTNDDLMTMIIAVMAISVLVNQMPMLAIVPESSLNVLDEDWKDVGCDCERCNKQRLLRAQLPTGKPN